MKMDESSPRKIKKIFKSAYLFLLIDQHGDGLWGKSFKPEKVRLYSHIEEAQFAKMRKRVKSITATFHALEAIYTFTNDHEHPSIKQALACLPKHRDVSGGYGAFGSLISVYPKPQYQIMINPRHTATALLIYFLFEDRIDQKIAESIAFLINHQKADGGWSTDGNSEYLTTSHILKLLTIIKKRKIERFLPKDYSFKVNKAIRDGLIWLKRNNEQNNGFWIFSRGDEGKKILYHSGAVLAIFPELRNYLKELYEKSLFKVTFLQNEDGGWPSSLKGKSEIKSTIVILNALVSSGKENYSSQIEKGMDFIVRNRNLLYTKSFDSVDWALLLKLAKYKNIYIEKESDHKIRNLAKNISKNFDQGNINFVKILPKSFHKLKIPLLEIFKNYHPDILEIFETMPVLHESILILGSYAPEFKKELIEVKEYLLNKGYKAYLVKDLPILSKSHEEKEKLCMVCSKFSIWIYRSSSWAISEYEYAKDLLTVLAILAPKYLAQSLRNELKITRRSWIKVFDFNQSPFEVIDSAIKWAEKEKRRKGS